VEAGGRRGGGRAGGVNRRPRGGLVPERWPCPAPAAGAAGLHPAAGAACRSTAAQRCPWPRAGAAWSTCTWAWTDA
jgi:hypothetical protein